MESRISAKEIINISRCANVEASSLAVSKRCAEERRSLSPWESARTTFYRFWKERQRYVNLVDRGKKVVRFHDDAKDMPGSAISSAWCGGDDQRSGYSEYGNTYHTIISTVTETQPVAKTLL